MRAGCAEYLDPLPLVTVAPIRELLREQVPCDGPNNEDPHGASKLIEIQDNNQPLRMQPNQGFKAQAQWYAATALASANWSSLPCRDYAQFHPTSTGRTLCTSGRNVQLGAYLLV